MKLGTNKLLGILALLFAIVAGLVIFLYINQAGSPGQGSSRDTVTAVVAAQNIPANVAVTQDMLEEKELPADVVLSQTFRSAEEAAGGVSKVDIYSGEQVLKNRVFSGEVESGFAYFVPSDKRAVAFEYSPVNCVGGLVAPNDMIDVLVTYVSPGDPNGLPSTSTVVQNVEVLAVGTEYERKDEKDKGENDNSTVTLALSPEQAEVVTLAEDYGTLKFALRSPVNDQVEAVPPAVITDFTGGE